MKGLGTDIVEVERIATILQKDNGFRELVFSKVEIEYCESQQFKYESYAARFAAKEAFLKALGTGWAESGVALHEIQITNNILGKPEISLTGESAKMMQEHQISTILVSLSHIKTLAVATVIIS